MAKLWEKGTPTNQQVEAFTVGNDRELDIHLAPFDVLGTLAHITMLETIGLLTKEELTSLKTELKNIYQLTQKQQFVIEPGVEDVHSQVELLLTQKLGDMGKKVHSGRSRNDQVLVDVKLFLRAEIEEVTHLMQGLFNTLIQLSEKHKEVLIPGYTHLQIAMPSSFGLWFGAYAEGLTDDLELLKASYNVVNQNPLGSAAGYGSSFPLNRQLTTDLLGFANLNYNVVYAQMTRGKSEQTLSYAMAGIASTLSKMAMDMCLYNSQNFGFVSFPDEFTTGSSIMPHKKNPDVWELVRGKCNLIKSLPNQISLLTSNLPSGYHRDLQLLKEQIIPALNELKATLAMTELMLEKIQIKTDVLADPKYNYLFSVEEVNRLVLAGVPFRDAYKQVAQTIGNEDFQSDHTVHHTHEGSIGNLCNEQIVEKFKRVKESFSFEQVHQAIQKLITT
ncbi:MAG: argininosuccinate lyase [Salinivirgaceae bacterium]